MPKVAFDNLNDVQTKFVNTICMYGDKAIYVKSIAHDDPDNPGKDFSILAQFSSGKTNVIKLSDPKFNYTNFNLGYINTNYMASWWYRKPIRQYRQGLKRDQMGYIIANLHMQVDKAFGFDGYFSAMLENRYSSIDRCLKILKGPNPPVSHAFHKDFALQWDELHESCVVEYQGVKIGVSIDDRYRKFRLINDYKHLEEYLKEVLNNVH